MTVAVAAVGMLGPLWRWTARTLVTPAGPCGPAAPCAPAGPCGPAVPAGPAGPCWLMTTVSSVAKHDSPALTSSARTACGGSMAMHRVISPFPPTNQPNALTVARRSPATVASAVTFLLSRRKRFISVISCPLFSFFLESFVSAVCCADIAGSTTRRQPPAVRRGKVCAGMNVLSRLPSHGRSYERLVETPCVDGLRRRDRAVTFDRGIDTRTSRSQRRSNKGWPPLRLQGRAFTVKTVQTSPDARGGMVDPRARGHSRLPLVDRHFKSGRLRTPHVASRRGARLGWLRPGSLDRASRLLQAVQSADPCRLPARMATARVTGRSAPPVR